MFVQEAGLAKERGTRVNVLLDDEHAARLHRIAERMFINPGTLARSLLSTALDQADPDPASITALLDSTPGAWERAHQGVADVAAGRVTALDEL